MAEESGGADGTDVLLSLQRSLRGELKEPMGPLYTDADELLAAAGVPLVAVGDVVTHHLLAAGRTPDLALVDARTEREVVADEVAESVETADFDRRVRVDNPSATLTAGLLGALAEGLVGGTTLIDVDGEEDLATLPAVLAAPEGASVVYGQPGEGMVLVTVTEEATAAVQDLLERMEGDTAAALRALGR